MTRVLVVEDEESYSEALAYMLRKEGFEVAIAADGHAALTEFDRNGADIVLLDLMLPGIPAEDIERIFERFYRVDPARHRSTGGTGLGLAIVKHVAATHGGDISVWSVEGQGSTFTLTLPRNSSPEHGSGTTPVEVVVPIDPDARSITRSVPPARRTQQETST